MMGPYTNAIENAKVVARDMAKREGRQLAIIQEKGVFVIIPLADLGDRPFCYITPPGDLR